MSYVFPNEMFPVTQETEYPIRHYISNEGNIPNDCVYINFTLIASSEAGTSSIGFITGGFAIGISIVIVYNHRLMFSVQITMVFGIVTVVCHGRYPAVTYNNNVVY